MATIHSLADHRAKVSRQPDVKATPLSFTRSPAMLLVMALYEQMPRKYRAPALMKVMQAAERCPDCQASHEAANVAALLTLALSTKEGR
ncbi:hypothetical protein D9601_10275 [Sphingomonas sp. MA1305]|uniref:hypothetical protein n=1 Tax=Sphingomonas sp. MA1305 TaxID=2479204 RepID=UPI0018E04B97|nr:hypothetical protein [Sphingomonas sp. MA1305]MBI0475737.1 hypothetical protein [Sphingomonas sp. MA1305]